MKSIKIDRFILISIFILYLISILSIKSASMYLSSNLGNLVLKQTIWYLIGLILIFIILRFDNNFFYKYSFVIYIINCLLLIGLLFFAPSINGSKCWFNIGGFSFQPSELMKISLIITLSITISKFKHKKNKTLKDEFLLILKMILLNCTY